MNRFFLHTPTLSPVLLQTQVSQLDAQAAQSIETVSSMYVMKSRALKDVVVDSRYKAKQVVGAGDAGQTQDFFPDVRLLLLLFVILHKSPIVANSDSLYICNYVCEHART